MRSGSPAARTATTNSPEWPDIDIADGNAATLDILHEGPHWHGTLLLQRLDAEFRADNGYIPQVGIRRSAGELRYKLSDLPRIAELAPYVSGDWREDLDGTLVSIAPRAGALTTFTNNLVLTTEWRPREQLRLHAMASCTSTRRGTSRSRLSGRAVSHGDAFGDLR